MTTTKTILNNIKQRAMDAALAPVIEKFNQDLSTGGVKHDIGKPRYELIAPEFLHGLAEILTFGAEKYDDRNWEKGMAWGRPFGALQRHLWAWWNGEEIDAETGKSHLHHAACCLMFLSAYEARGIGVDDRKLRGDPEAHRAIEFVKNIPVLDTPLTRKMQAENRIVEEPELPWPDDITPTTFKHLVLRLDTNDETAAKAYNDGTLRQHYHALKKRKIYLAGPMRNIPHFNFPAFHQATEKLRALGFYVFNPAEADVNRQNDDAFVALNTTGDLDKAAERGFDLRSALAEDTAFISKEADLIAMLPGWERSKGAIAEKALATALGLDVIYLNGEYPNFGN